MVFVPSIARIVNAVQVTLVNDSVMFEFLSLLGIVDCVKKSLNSQIARIVFVF